MKNKKKMTKKSSHSFAIFLISLAVVSFGYMAVATEGFGLFERQVTFEQAENVIINFPPGQAEALQAKADFSLGGGAFVEGQEDIATSTTDFQNLGNVNIFSDLRFGDDPVIGRDGVTYGFLIKSFVDATTTESFENTSGRTVYVASIGLRFDGMPTTTVQYFVGTTSDGFFRGIDEGGTRQETPDNTITAIFDNINIADGGIYDATNTTIWLETNGEWYPPVKGFGIWRHGDPLGTVWATTSNPLAVPILPGEFLTVHASSTVDDDTNQGAIMGSGNLFDTSIFVSYRFFD